MKDEEHLALSDLVLLRDDAAAYCRASGKGDGDLSIVDETPRLPISQDHRLRLRPELAFLTGYSVIGQGVRAGQGGLLAQEKSLMVTGE